MVPVAVIAQAGLARIDGQVDRSAPAAIAAIGASAGHVGFVPKARGAIAAVTGTDPDSDDIEEHWSILACGSDAAAAGPRDRGWAGRLVGQVEWSRPLRSD
jgi:hypothetical protein